MIIAFEGADKVGKSTAIRETQILLDENKYSSIVIKPQFIPGKITELKATGLFRYSDDIEALLYLTHFVSNELSLIKPFSKRYDFVLLDRYIDSCWIFNTMMLKTEKPKEFYQKIFKEYIDSAIKPDLTILLTASTTEIKKRLKLEKHSRFENLPHIKKIQYNFKLMAESHKHERFYEEIDTTKTTKEEVGQLVINAIKRRII